MRVGVSGGPRTRFLVLPWCRWSRRIGRDERTVRIRPSLLLPSSGGRGEGGRNYTTHATAGRRALARARFRPLLSHMCSSCAHIQRDLGRHLPCCSCCRRSDRRPGEGRGKERSLSWGLFCGAPAAANIQCGRRRWPPAIRSRTPVSIADPSIRNDVGARAAVSHCQRHQRSSTTWPVSSLGHQR